MSVAPAKSLGMPDKEKSTLISFKTLRFWFFRNRSARDHTATSAVYLVIQTAHMLIWRESNAKLWSPAFPPPLPPQNPFWYFGTHNPLSQLTLRSIRPWYDELNQVLHKSLFCIYYAICMPCILYPRPLKSTSSKIPTWHCTRLNHKLSAETVVNGSLLDQFLQNYGYRIYWKKVFVPQMQP